MLPVQGPSPKAVLNELSAGIGGCFVSFLLTGMCGMRGKVGTFRIESGE